MRIGILTHYYRSENYGGNLQAYALCRILNKMGHQAQQISLDRSGTKNWKCRVVDTLDIIRSYRHKGFVRNIKRRKRAIGTFNRNLIPHSKVYLEKNIGSCIDGYDAFVAGSDQVWHPLACCDAYLLKFVPSNKIKMSYAASVATDNLSHEYLERYQLAFQDYKAISVREQGTVAMMQKIAPVKVECTLDPTLLLSRQEWDEIATSYSPKEKYLLCYFLGENVKQRALATEFAEKHNLKLVTLPHLLGKYRECDAQFGDSQLYGVTPQMLLALIREAEYIFTDSFHATVFSLLYEKQHVIFSRSGAKGMSVRLQSLTDIFGNQRFFCDTQEKMCVEYIETLGRFDYSKSFDRFLCEKKKSIHFLEKNLCK